MDFIGTVVFKNRKAEFTIKKIKDNYNLNTMNLQGKFIYRELIKEVESCATAIVREKGIDDCYLCFFKTQLWVVEPEDVYGFLPVINDNGNIRVCHKDKFKNIEQYLKGVLGG